MEFASDEREDRGKVESSVESPARRTKVPTSESRASDGKGADSLSNSPVGRMTSKQAFARTAARMTAKEAAGASLQRMTEREGAQRAAGAGVSREAEAARGRNRGGLPEQLKDGIEGLSGMSMDDVKVRYNSAAPAHFQALAYTRGLEIHVAPGQERHLPHEAWHVVQQRQGRVRPTAQIEGVGLNDEPALEAEADVMGVRAARAGGGGGLVSLARGQSRLASKGERADSARLDHSPIQRAKLNIRLKDKTISGVSDLPDRPPSNLRGKQGQHLTAYVVFEDMIRASVEDKTVEDAAKALIGVLDSIEKLPGMGKQSAQYLKPYITQVRTNLKKSPVDQALIGEQIDTILTIRNQVPLTAQQGKGGGKGESAHAGKLRTLEEALRRGTWDPAWDEKKVAREAREQMWMLLDYDPSEPKNEDQEKEIVNIVLTHFLSLRMAYPAVFRWLTDRRDYLFHYLEANRKQGGMPLQQLDQDTLAAIRNKVHQGL